MLKIFIGTEPKTEIARKVLENSILRHSSLKEEQVEFIPMLGEGWRDVKSTKHGTGFSLNRWRIPEMCDYQGFAIYLDADIVALDDIAKLYQCDTNFPNDKVSTWCCYYKSPKISSEIDTPETSVMLIDCAKAKENQPNYDACVKYINEVAGTSSSARLNYFKIMRALKHQNLPQRIPHKFNRLNSLVTGEENVLLHYTKEPQQPWYNPNHAHTDVWEAELKCAIDCEAVTKEEVEKAISEFEPHTKQKRGTGMNPWWRKVL